MTFRLGEGTVYILDPVDDLTFTHECEFVNSSGQWRKAYVFRWLQVARHFKVSTRGMVTNQLDGKPVADALPAGQTMGARHPFPGACKRRAPAAAEQGRGGCVVLAYLV
jgi:hypothetical protein